MDADIVTCHVPLNKTGIDKTLHLFDRELFSRVQPGCIFMNAARGGVVETQSIKNAIRAKQLKHAVLDVWENEPELDLELLQMVDIGTSHIAGYSLDGKINGTRLIREGFCRFFDIQSQWDPSGEMTPPDVDSIEVPESEDAIEMILFDTVRQCYDIERDYRDLLDVVNHPEDKGPRFVQLRRTYPVRREFFNTQVKVPEKHSAVARVLSTWGFKIFL